MGQLLVYEKKNKNEVVYQYRFEVMGVDGHRKSVTKSGFRTRREARKAGQQAYAAYETRGVLAAPSDISMGDLLYEWIDADVAKRCKETTVAGYKKKIRLYLMPLLGNKNAAKLTKKDIQDFLYYLFDQGYSPNTISSVKGILTKCFKYAVDNQIVLSSPANGIPSIGQNGKPPTIETRSKEHIFLTEDNMRAIFERFPEGDDYHLPIQLGYRCGLRIAEAFALTWEDIDLKNKTLSVNRQIQWHKDETRSEADKKKKNGTSEAGKGYWYFSAPKYNSYRTIDLDDDLVALLQRTRDHYLKAKKYYGDKFFEYYSTFPMYYGKGGKPPRNPQHDSPITVRKTANPVHFIFVRDNGLYNNFRNMQYVNKVIHEKIGIEGYDFHSLRHTHATMLEESGAPLIYIQRRLGHKKPQVTQSIYLNHLTENSRNKGISALNDMYKTDIKNGSEE